MVESVAPEAAVEWVATWEVEIRETPVLYRLRATRHHRGRHHRLLGLVVPAAVEEMKVEVVWADPQVPREKLMNLDSMA